MSTAFPVPFLTSLMSIAAPPFFLVGDLVTGDRELHTVIQLLR